MGMTFADILDALVAYRDLDNDDGRRAAQLDAIEFALQRTLEKLRDMHDPN